MLDTKYIDAKSTGYTLPPGMYENNDVISVLRSSLPDDINVNITLDTIRLGSNLTTNKTIRFSKKYFFCTI